MKTGNPIVHIDEVDYVYPNNTTALNEISLRINEGELVAIMGQNGAGKTTLIRTLNGLIRPTKGSIYIKGENNSTKSIAELSKIVGIIFQNPLHQLFSNNIEEELKFSLKNLNYTKEQIQLKVNSILVKFNLEKYRDRSPFNLSGGEAKKLALATILCREPEILVFDEPTLGQDAKEIAFFLEIIHNEIESGKTIIIVTHNIEFAYENIPRTILMAHGHIIADGPTEQVLTNDFLVDNASLVLPQIHQLKLGLEKIGINVPNAVFKEQEMISFINQYFKVKLQTK
ncbi:MAG: ABC transporter ATP-binding protein [Candidatus Lokiarchaeota archaeon]